MTSDTLLQMVLGAILLSVIGIRLYYMKNLKLPAQGKPGNAKKIGIAPRIGMLAGFSLIVIALVNPVWMSWSCLPLPLWLRWCGAGLGVVAVGLLFWVHHSLGQNFSPQIRIRQEHALCTSGPYRWVRHPMYTVLFMLSIAWIIGLANWLVGVFWLTIQTMVIGNRIGKEESELLEHFGDEYRAYMRRTGRFLPRLRHLNKIL